MPQANVQIHARKNKIMTQRKLYFSFILCTFEVLKFILCIVYLISKVSVSPILFVVLGSRLLKINVLVETKVIVLRNFIGIAYVVLLY